MTAGGRGSPNSEWSPALLHTPLAGSELWNFSGLAMLWIGIGLVLEKAQEGDWVEVESNSVGSWQLPQWRLEGAVGRFGIGTVGANDSEHLNHRNPWAIRCPVRAAVRRCGGLKPALSDSLRGSVSNLPSVFPSAAERYRWALDGAGFDTPPRVAS